MLDHAVGEVEMSGDLTDRPAAVDQRCDTELKRRERGGEILSGIYAVHLAPTLIVEKRDIVEAPEILRVIVAQAAFGDTLQKRVVFAEKLDQIVRARLMISGHKAVPCFFHAF